MTFTHTGAEYLIYMNGETGNPYYVGEYPLKRLEAGETNLEKAWVIVMVIVVARTSLALLTWMGAIQASSLLVVSIPAINGGF